MNQGSFHLVDSVNRLMAILHLAGVVGLVRVVVIRLLCLTLCFPPFLLFTFFERAGRNSRDLDSVHPFYRQTSAH
jgi:hypothetical protein